MVKNFSLLFALCSLLFAVPLSAEEKYVAFTFDDGPHPYYTEQLLKILRNYSVHATFFLVGAQAEKHPEIVKLIISQGHEIGNHSFDNHRLITQPIAGSKEKILKTKLILEKLSGKNVKYFRPPGGRYNFSILRDIKDIEITLWTINTSDIDSTSHQIRGKALLAEDGDIVLFHSGVRQTLAALPGILRTLKKRGIKVVSIGGLQEFESRKAFSRACSQELY